MSYDTSVSSILQNAMVSADIYNETSDFQFQGSFQCKNFQHGSSEVDGGDFKHEIFRQLSLLAWINKHVSKDKLARYGFYYNLDSDYVKCYFCEVVIGEWGVGDDPLTEHHKHSPDCDFINMKPTDNVPIGDELSLQNELKAIQESLNLRRRGASKFNADLLPRHPDYKDEKSRLDSYLNWPKFMRQTPKDLSAAGFFYLGVGDEVKCFFCGGCLKDWEDTDTPIDEHKKHFYDKCLFLKKNYQELKRNYSKKTCKNLVKATPAQINKLTSYMNSNPDLKEGKINLGSNKLLYNQMWETLSETLNSFDGPRKNTKAWKEVWRNHKYNSKRKLTPASTPDRIDEEPPRKQTKIYHFETREFSNLPRVEPDTTSAYQHFDVYNNNAAIPTSSNMITEYQPNLEQSYCGTTTGLNKNFELELNKQKFENERLQFELHKLRNDLEKQQLQRQIELVKQELEKNRFETDNGISYLQLL